MNVQVYHMEKQKIKKGGIFIFTHWNGGVVLNNIVQVLLKSCFHMIPKKQHCYVNYINLIIMAVLMGCKYLIFHVF